MKITIINKIGFGVTQYEDVASLIYDDTDNTVTLKDADNDTIATYDSDAVLINVIF